VKEKDGAYDLTFFGCQMLLTVVCIASKVVQDRGQEGLAISAREIGWEEG
jgi:hypothetical protein